MISLPLQVFDFVKSPEPNMIARGFGAAATLMLLVLAALRDRAGDRRQGTRPAVRPAAPSVVAASARDAMRMGEQRALAASVGPVAGESPSSGPSPRSGPDADPTPSQSPDPSPHSSPEEDPS